MIVLTKSQTLFRLAFAAGVGLWLLSPEFSRWASGFLVGLVVGSWITDQASELEQRK